jgi:hypothetical protein
LKRGTENHCSLDLPRASTPQSTGALKFASKLEDSKHWSLDVRLEASRRLKALRRFRRSLDVPSPVCRGGWVYNVAARKRDGNRVGLSARFISPPGSVYCLVWKSKQKAESSNSANTSPSFPHRNPRAAAHLPPGSQPWPLSLPLRVILPGQASVRERTWARARRCTCGRPRARCTSSGSQRGPRAERPGNAITLLRSCRAACGVGSPRAEAAKQKH